MHNYRIFFKDNTKDSKSPVLTEHIYETEKTNFTEATKDGTEYAEKRGLRVVMIAEITTKPDTKPDTNPI